MKLALNQVRTETLLGVLVDKLPLPPNAMGNCMTIGNYFVRNLSAENYAYWRAQHCGISELEVEEVMDNVVEIVDERVPEELLREKGCSICEAQAMVRKKR